LFLEVPLGVRAERLEIDPEHPVEDDLQLARQPSPLTGSLLLGQASPVEVARGTLIVARTTRKEVPLHGRARCPALELVLGTELSLRREGAFRALLLPKGRPGKTEREGKKKKGRCHRSNRHGCSSSIQLMAILFPGESDYRPGRPFGGIVGARG
jgi:hypothetical protein